MYTITLLSQQQQGFLTDLTARNQISTVQVSMALGRVISRLVPVPGTALESIDTYFHQNAEVINQILESINGVAPIDYEAARDFALQFFRYSYDAAHGDVLMYGGVDGLSCFFRLSKHFSAETIAYLQENGQAISHLVTSFDGIVKALTPTSSN